MDNPSPLRAQRGNSSPKPWRAELLPWLPIIIGLAVLFVPSLYDLFRGVWSEDEQAHGPIVLAISCWLIYRKWPDMINASANKPAPVPGWSLLALGLISYVIGRSQAIIQMEIGAVLPVASR